MLSQTGQISVFDLVRNIVGGRILELLPTPKLSPAKVKSKGVKSNLPFILEMNVDSKKLADLVWEENKNTFEQYSKIADYANHVFRIGGIIKVYDKNDSFLKDIRTPQEFVEKFPKLSDGEQIVGVMEESERKCTLIDFENFGL